MKTLKLTITPEDMPGPIDSREREYNCRNCGEGNTLTVKELRPGNPWKHLGVHCTHCGCLNQMCRAYVEKLFPKYSSAEVASAGPIVAQVPNACRAPVQGSDNWRRGGLSSPAYGLMPAGSVSWQVHEQAWREYARAGHGDQSAKRIAERGGFSYREIQCCLAQHYNDGPACATAHPPIPTWEAQ